MKDIKEKKDIEMTQDEEFEFLPENSEINYINKELINKNLENSVDGSENSLSISDKDNVNDIKPSYDGKKIINDANSQKILVGDNNDNPDFSLKISDGIKKKLPDDFNFNDIGRIDLKEAEAIANEDVLFLTEEDLIEGLEDFDLIPLRDENLNEDIIKKRPEKKDEASISGKKSVIEESASSEKFQKLPNKIVVNNLQDEKKLSGNVDIPVEKTVPPLDDVNTEILSSHAEYKTETKDNDIFIEDENKSSDDQNLKTIFSEEEKNKIVKSDPFILKDSHEPDYTHVFDKEVLSDELKEIEQKSDNVVFIDDLPGESIAKKMRVFDENELERATSDIVEITSRNVRLLTEAGIEKTIDTYRFITLVKDTSASQQDLFLDFADIDYKYRDSELEFIDGAIFEDDYSRYIHEIDDFYEEDKIKKGSAAVEIFGIGIDENLIISDRLFAEEYKNIDLDKEVDLFKSDFGIIDLFISKDRFFNYLLPSENSLTEFERLSIEEDISSKGAIIFEEDIDEIRKLYGKDITDSPLENEKIIHDINKDSAFEKEFGIVIDISDNDMSFAQEEYRELEKIDNDFVIIEENNPVEEVRAKAQVADEKEPVEEVIEDITDKIVILEDDLDIDRFVKEFPEKKAGDLKGLLKYLDGLFEKLPESTIRNFANSEYFDLYVKILGEMGI